jgi:hypothetical protein
MAELGFLGMMVSPENTVAVVWIRLSYVIAMEEISKVDAS